MVGGRSPAEQIFTPTTAKHYKPLQTATTEMRFFEIAFVYTRIVVFICLSSESLLIPWRCAMNGYKTLGQVAQELRLPFYRLRYVVSARRIEPSAILGQTRLWTPADVEKIRVALDEIREKKEAQADARQHQSA